MGDNGIVFQNASESAAYAVSSSIMQSVLWRLVLSVDADTEDAT